MEPDRTSGAWEPASARAGPSARMRPPRRSGDRGCSRRAPRHGDSRAPTPCVPFTTIPTAGPGCATAPRSFERSDPIGCPAAVEPEGHPDRETDRRDRLSGEVLRIEDDDV